MSKDLFLKQSKLASEWRGIAGSQSFEQVLTYARAQIAQQGPTREELRGVELLAQTLLNIAEPDDLSFVFPSPGLNHQPDTMPEPEKPKKSKKK